MRPSASVPNGRLSQPSHNFFHEPSTREGERHQIRAIPVSSIYYWLPRTWVAMGLEEVGKTVRPQTSDLKPPKCIFHLFPAFCPLPRTSSLSPLDAAAAAAAVLPTASARSVPLTVDLFFDFSRDQHLADTLPPPTPFPVEAQLHPRFAEGAESWCLSSVLTVPDRLPKPFSRFAAFSFWTVSDDQSPSWRVWSLKSSSCCRRPRETEVHSLQHVCHAAQRRPGMAQVARLHRA
ncbi:hypothetical protein B0H63DRAFT_240576 [Podospora didyma]|uniref:Uncharacterized protein n=1 Tax=Podospora didyma TaxID=330526 RepID=A0AAE0KL25_9PEZI|nr:hypothetical protein B0H63DRAFT_240576 [Podospora didyma]